MKKEDLISSYKQHKPEIQARLKEFSQNPRQLEELFFCLLTPQSKAEKCWEAVQELEKCTLNEKSVSDCLKTKTRFHNNKTKYIIEASNKWKLINNIINSNNNPIEKRNLLVNEVRGLGMKETSHFLRNIGKSNNELAILDRHILRNLINLKIIDKEYKLDKSNYLKIEEKMKQFSKQVKIPLDELDLLFFKIESGRIFK